MPPRSNRPAPRDHLAPGAQQRKNVFDLDALERDGEVRGPFTFRAGGREWTLSDPAELDWQEAFDVQLSANPRIAMRSALGAEQYEQFCKLPPRTVPDWKMAALAKAWQEHHSMGEDGASPA